MTIHSDWARILHDECPEAFLGKPPPDCKFGVGIIDGHLQLMRLDPRMRTWECFIRNQFLKPITEMLAYGCPRVVLCFDNYANVPLYKSMTQKARTNKVEVKVFGLHEELPPFIPEDPMPYLMNRNFKLKLIDMLCRKIPQLLLLEKHQEFILDYKKVVLYPPLLTAVSVDTTTQGPSASLSCVRSTSSSTYFPALPAPHAQYHLVPSPTLMEDMMNMGESDVKFIRYVHKYGSALVHAIDGDYMTIALLYYTEHLMQENNKIFIFRQFSVLQSSGATADETKEIKSTAFRKMMASGPVVAASAALSLEVVQKSLHFPMGITKNNNNSHGGGGSLSSHKRKSMEDCGQDQDKKSQRKEPQPKCWVDIQLLFTVIAQAMKQSGYHQAQLVNSTTLLPLSERDAVFSAVFLMLCAGTDFSRNIPMIGPKRIWDSLQDIAVPTIQALRGGGGETDENMLVNLVVGKLYSNTYCNHLLKSSTCTASQKKRKRACVQVASKPFNPKVGGGEEKEQSFDQIMSSLKKSKLSERTKSSFPSTDRIRNTIKNVRWVMKYWGMQNGNVETPLDGTYGYAMDQTGGMNFQDLIPALLHA